MCDDGFILLSGKEDSEKYFSTIVAIETAVFKPPWTENDFRAEINDSNSHSLLLVTSGLLAGYLFAKQAADEISLNKLCIHREYRERGWGKLLLRKFLGRHRNTSRRMFLEVATTNTPAIALYRSCGFVVVRVRKKIYASGADALEMVYEYPDLHR